MSVLNRILLSGVFAALVSACSVGPDYVRPDVATPAGYREAGDWKLAAPADQQPRGPWWEVFDDPVLNTLVARVDVSNQDVLAAAARLRQSEALVQQARAGLFPEVSVNAASTRSHSPASGNTATTDSLLLDVPWEIDFWGKIRREVEANRASAAASAADLETARLSAQATLAQDYFLLRIADAQQQLLDHTVADYARALEITRNRYAAGVVARIDVAQADAQLKSTQARAIDVGVQRAQLEHAIAVLTGQPPAAFSLAATDATVAIPSIPPALPAELLERRPDIAGAERRVAAANAQIGVARAAYFPNLSLSATGGYTGNSGSALLTAANRFWSVGPALAETLFDAGLRRAQNEQAIAAYDASVADYRQTVLAGFQEVEDNLAALRILAAEATAQDAAVAATRRARELSMNQYKTGTVNYLTVVTAQTAQLASELAAVSIQGRRLNASVLLIKALGGGWRGPGAASRQ
jgi:NodT family efflux transporter outer membrane factor (OMF) lipoprotein